MAEMRIRPLRLFERPQARVLEEGPGVEGTRSLILRVDGMVCDI